MEQKKSLDRCAARGAAVPWVGKLFKCLAEDICASKQDFGGVKYCAESLQERTAGKENDRKGRK